MLGFFNKLFKSKTPAPETQTQPENTAAETAEQTAEPAAEQATEHSAQLEASANESANESASVETAEPEPAAQAQPENPICPKRSLKP